MILQNGWVRRMMLVVKKVASEGVFVRMRFYKLSKRYTK